MRKFMALVVALVVVIPLVFSKPVDADTDGHQRTFHQPEWFQQFSETFNIEWQQMRNRFQSEQDQKPQQSTKTKKPGEDKKEKKPDSSDSAIKPFEKQVVKLTNKERTKRGLNPLKIDKKLSKMARKKSEDMRDSGYFDHKSPNYGSPFDMMKQFDIHFTAAGENIAAGQKTPEQVVEAWMHSEGHRKNILNDSFTHIGLGYVEGGKYGTYWSQEFTRK